MTGGFFHSLFHTKVNVFTYTAKVLEYGIVRNPYNFQASGFQCFRSVRIFSLIFRVIMLRTVQFQDQSCIVTIKVNNIAVNHLLSQKTNRIAAQKVIPQAAFFLRHIFAKGFRMIGQCGIMFPFQNITCFVGRRISPSQKSNRFLTAPFRQGGLVGRGKAPPLLTNQQIT